MTNNPPSLPAGRRVYAVGDVHGMLGEFQALRRAIAADSGARDPCAQAIVYLGDFIDRGSESRAVVETLIAEPLPDFEQICLKGNHEETLLRFLANAGEGPLWFENGGDATLASYGVEPPEFRADLPSLQRARLDFVEHLPKAHLKFYRELRHSYSDGDYFFVHAGVRPGIPLEQQAVEDLIWIRGEFLRSTEDFGKVIVHGHTITETPDIRANRVGIDTGAYRTGRLTCLVLEGTERRFLST